MDLENYSFLTNRKKEWTMSRSVSLIFTIVFLSLVFVAAIACVTLLCVFACPFWEIICAGIFALIVGAFWYDLISASLKAYD